LLFEAVSLRSFFNQTCKILSTSLRQTHPPIMHDASRPADGHAYRSAQVFVLSTHPSRELRFVGRQSWSRWNLGARRPEPAVHVACRPGGTRTMPVHVQQAARCGTTRLAVRSRWNGDRRAGAAPCAAPDDKLASTPFLHPGRGCGQRELPRRGPRQRIPAVDVVRAGGGDFLSGPGWLRRGLDCLSAARGGHVTPFRHCDFAYARREKEKLQRRVALRP
jgi:hypothetical protein